MLDLQINLICILYLAWLSYPAGITEILDIEPQIKSAHNGYRDQVIWIMRIQQTKFFKSLILWLKYGLKKNATN